MTLSSDKLPRFIFIFAAAFLIFLAGFYAGGFDSQANDNASSNTVLQPTSNAHGHESDEQDHDSLSFEELCASNGHDWMSMPETRDGEFISSTPCSGCMANALNHVCDKDEYLELLEHSQSAGLEGEVKTERVPLEPELVDGVKVFKLTAKPIVWEISEGKVVEAWAYNEQIPGPEIRANKGDTIRVILKNELPEPTTIHWHGIRVPNEMDGVPGVTQDPVMPGETFTYEFELKDSGSYWYHSHVTTISQVDMGLSGPLVVLDGTEDYDKEFNVFLDDWVTDSEGRNLAKFFGKTEAGHNHTYNYFTINGKSYPATEELKVKVGEKVRLRVFNAGVTDHPMHLHGQFFNVVAKDGQALPEPFAADTIEVTPGERYDLEFIAEEPGTWMMHCHNAHHTTTDGLYPGGLMTKVVIEE